MQEQNLNQKKVLAKIQQLKEFFDNGQIPQLEKHEVHPLLPRHSRKNYLYFTLPPCVNFQRSSPAMWQSALKTYEDPQTNHVFSPEKLMHIDYEQFKSDMAKHNLALLRNKHCDIWYKISETFYKHYDSNPRNLLEQCDFDVLKIKDMVQIKKRELFPHLRGTKLCNYWLMIIDKFTDANLKNTQEISIIPDVHVIKASCVLGICKEKETPEKVAEAWQVLLKDSDIIPVTMHPILWHWSRNNFQPFV